MRGILEKIVYYAKLAPSYNEQFIKFFVQNDTISIQLIQLKQTDQDLNTYLITGSVLENLVIAANYYGFKEKIDYNFGNSETFINVVLTPTYSSTKETLFNKLEVLRPATDMYANKDIAAEHLAQLIIAAKETDVFLKLYTGADAISSVASLLDGLALQTTIEANQQLATTPSWIERLLSLTYDGEDQEAAAAMKPTDNAAALIFLTALKNEKLNWIDVGRTYQRLALLSASFGIDYTLINLPLSNNSKTKELKEVLSYTTEAPLVVLKLGYGVKKVTVNNKNPRHVLLNTN